MTDKIKEYFKLLNTPRCSSLDEEMKVIENIRTIMGDVPKVGHVFVTRYIRDTGSKMICIYESRQADESEIGFVLRELQKKYPYDKVFAVQEDRYEVIDDGLE